MVELTRKRTAITARLVMMAGRAGMVLSLLASMATTSTSTLASHSEPSASRSGVGWQHQHQHQRRLAAKVVNNLFKKSRKRINSLIQFFYHIEI
jgi:hypothetical protein